MTLPRVVKDLLMLAPSFKRVPLAPVESARSEPAKSTKLIFETFSVVRSVILSWRRWVKNMVKTAWERELVSFMLVAATVLRERREIIYKQSLIVLISIIKSKIKKEIRNLIKIIMLNFHTNIIYSPLFKYFCKIYFNFIQKDYYFFI